MRSRKWIAGTVTRWIRWSMRGDEYGRDDVYEVERREEENWQRKVLRDGFDALTETQRRRLLLSIQGKTVREVAAIEKADIRAVHDSLQQARKNFDGDTQQKIPFFCAYSERDKKRYQPLGKERYLSCMI